MALLGQASGGFTESSSALRLLYVGVRNSIGVLSDDAFTQTNPPVVTTASTISTNVDTQVFGVLSGSVAFTRPDQGSNVIGGPAESLADASLETFVRPLGLFINNAAGNAFENAPAAASGKGPYVSSQGSHGSQLFETQALGASTGGTTLAQGDDLTYVAGQELIQRIGLCLVVLRYLGREFGTQLVELIGIPRLKFLTNIGERRFRRHLFGRPCVRRPKCHGDQCHPHTCHRLRSHRFVSFHSVA